MAVIMRIKAADSAVDGKLELSGVVRNGKIEEGDNLDIIDSAGSPIENVTVLTIKYEDDFVDFVYEGDECTITTDCSDADLTADYFCLTDDADRPVEPDLELHTDDGKVLGTIGEAPRDIQDIKDEASRREIAKLMSGYENKTEDELKNLRHELGKYPDYLRVEAENNLKARLRQLADEREDAELGLKINAIETLDLGQLSDELRRVEAYHGSDVKDTYVRHLTARIERLEIVKLDELVGSIEDKEPAELRELSFKVAKSGCSTGLITRYRENIQSVIDRKIKLAFEAQFGPVEELSFENCFKCDNFISKNSVYASAGFIDGMKKSIGQRMNRYINGEADRLAGMVNAAGLGLTVSQQEGDVFRSKLGMDKNDMAVLACLYRPIYGNIEGVVLTLKYAYAISKGQYAKYPLDTIASIKAEKGSGIFAKPQLDIAFKSGDTLNLPVKLEAGGLQSTANAMLCYVVAASESSVCAILMYGADAKPQKVQKKSDMAPAVPSGNNNSRSVSGSSTVNKREFIFCTRCGNKMSAECRFCSRCGNRLGTN